MENKRRRSNTTHHNILVDLHQIHNQVSHLQPYIKNKPILTYKKAYSQHTLKKVMQAIWLDPDTEINSNWTYRVGTGIMALEVTFNNCRIIIETK